MANLAHVSIGQGVFLVGVPAVNIAEGDLVGTRHICDHRGHGVRMVERPSLVFVSERQVDGREFYSGEFLFAE